MIFRLWYLFIEQSVYPREYILGVSDIFRYYLETLTIRTVTSTQKVVKQQKSEQYNLNSTIVHSAIANYQL